MPANRIPVVPALILALATACSSPAPRVESLPAMELKVAWPNLTFERPVCTAVPPDGSGRVFLVEQGGRIKILPSDRDGRDAEIFLDISDREPLGGNEEGLLGFDFHPRFRENGMCYLYYSQHDPRRSVVSEIRISQDDPAKADLSTERILMEIPQPFGNHNSGPIVFGPDGYLYIALGDGGSANDPHGNGQNLKTLLGSVLRIAVDSRSGDLAYGIPPDNPFAGRKDGTRGEIWAYGLRNPWRMSFDRETGDLWLGDVGQDKWEEVNLIIKGGNYGWNAREGFHSFIDKGEIAVNHIDPVIEYPHPFGSKGQLIEHGSGLSITGGFVYRGQKIPALRGVYVYADYIVGTIWGLRYESGKLTHHGVLVDAPLKIRINKKPVVRAIAGFGEDAAGELLILAFDGRIYEFVSKEE